MQSENGPLIRKYSSDELAKMKEPPGVDLDFVAAKRGEWPSIARVLRKASDDLMAGKALPGWRASFLAGALERIQLPHLKHICVSAAKRLSNSEPVPRELAEPLVELLTKIVEQIKEARKRQEAALTEKKPLNTRGLFVPNSPPAHRFLDLDPEITVAFHLRKTSKSGGRPEKVEPPMQLFTTFRALLCFGASKTQAEQILAYRLGQDARTVRRYLKTLHKHGFSLTTESLEHDQGRGPKRRHPRGAPKIVLGFEPYLKARLCVAVQLLLTRGRKPRYSYQKVAKRFQLLFGDGDPCIDIVQKATELCEENRNDWALIPLRVCEHEIKRAPPIWPTLKRIHEVQALAAKYGVNPAFFDTVSQDTNLYRPSLDAVQAVMQEFHLSYDDVNFACRHRFPFSRLMAAAQSTES